jgi:hypothetical protein
MGPLAVAVVLVAQMQIALLVALTAVAVLFQGREVSALSELFGLLLA